MSALSYSFYKLFSLFFFPLGTALLAMLVAGVAFCFGRRRFTIILLMAAGGWLWFWSMPLVSDAVRGSLEAQFPFRPSADYPQADVIVVLGGGIEGAAFEGRTIPDLSGSADREWFAAQLYHAGKAPFLLVSAGLSPGRHTEPGAAGMATFLRALGVPGEALLLETMARNTLENARFIESMLVAKDARHILLVTSAYHMPRTLRLFSGSRVRITPAATDHEVIRVDFGIQRLLPEVGALERSTAAIHEYLGIWFMGLQQWF